MASGDSCLVWLIYKIYNNTNALMSNGGFHVVLNNKIGKIGFINLEKRDDYPENVNQAKRFICGFKPLSNHFFLRFGSKYWFYNS